jgi:hypothetical protein
VDVEEGRRERTPFLMMRDATGLPDDEETAIRRERQPGRAATGLDATVVSWKPLGTEAAPVLEVHE